MTNLNTAESLHSTFCIESDRHVWRNFSIVTSMPPTNMSVELSKKFVTLFKIRFVMTRARSHEEIPNSFYDLFGIGYVR